MGGIDDALANGAYKDFMYGVDDKTKLVEVWQDDGTIARLLMADALSRRALAMGLGSFKRGVMGLHEEEEEIEVYSEGICVISLL